MLVNPYIISLPVTPCVTAIAAGSYHTVAVKSDGTVVAWGSNTDFYGNVAGQSTVPAGLSGVIAVAAGGAHTLALKSNGTVAAWGNNNSGQVNGTAPVTTAGGNSLMLNVPAGLTGIKAVAAGLEHSLALANAIFQDNVTAWGSNSNGQIITPFQAAEQIAVGAGGSDAVYISSYDGGVHIFKDYDLSPHYRAELQPPMSLKLWQFGNHPRPVAVAAGVDHMVAARSDGTVVAWPTIETIIELGLPYQSEAVAYGATTVPDGLTGVIAVAAGRQHTLALTSNGTVVAWGANHYGQSSVPEGVIEYALTQAGALVGWRVLRSEGLSNVVAISAGDYHSVALKSDGTVVAWGNNDYGQTTVPNNLC